MAYAAVTSLMETLSLHFLQSQPRFPLEDLEAQIRLGNENVGLLQQILEAQIREMELDEEASSKRLQLAESSSQNERIINASDGILLTSRLREVGEVKQNIVSLHQNLGLLQQSLEKSEMACHDAEMKDLEAQIRDASFKAEERIEMELSAIYLAKDSLGITACLLRLHQIFNEAQKQIGYQIRDDCFYNFVYLEQLEKLRIKRCSDLNLVMCNISWATSLPNLKKLSFLKCCLQWSELSGISMLLNLEVLKLIDACEGLEWETCDGGFNRLKRLVIKSKTLQYWNIGDDHFPMLECLEISDCSRLKEIPRGFADITTLVLIQISKCRYSLVASAKWIQEEQSNNYGNDALLVRSENIRVSLYPSDIFSLTI
nr:putative late blight resistance protein homolog R1A-10 isoform X1 [Ipomoea batatas]